MISGEMKMIKILLRCCQRCNNRDFSKRYWGHLKENESGKVLGLIKDGDVRRAIESSEDFT